MTSKDRDLVEELLTRAHPSNVDVTDRAAARIEALSAENERLLDIDEVKANVIDSLLNDLASAEQENERLREALRSAIRNIENLTYDIKCHTECAECQSNVAMYEHAVEEYRAALGETE